MKLIVTSNRATITDVESVRNILKKYHSPLTVDVVADGETGAGTIKIHGVNWAFALRVDNMPVRSAYKSEDLWEKAVWKLYNIRGEKVFRQMLVELAQFLSSRLTVQLSRFSYTAFGEAKEWLIDPHSPEVRSNWIKGIADE